MPGGKINLFEVMTGCWKRVREALKAAIATLDNIMVTLFKKARRARHGAARRALLAQQEIWREQRDACGSDTACLEQRYGEGIGQLQ